MAGAEHTMDVNAPPAVLFDIITDYERYPEFLDGFKSAKVLERGEGYAIARFTLDLIKTVHYTIRLTEKKPDSVSWTLVESNLLKVNNGGWTLVELPGGRTRVTYRLEVGIGRFVPKMITDRLSGSTLPVTMKAFKERAEKLG